MKNLIAIVLGKFIIGIWKFFFFWLERKESDSFKLNPEYYTRLLFSNPILAGQAGNKEIFRPHFWIGHLLPEKNDFIGEKSFISFDEACDHILKSSAKVVLNIGDSSTSGWNSNVIRINRQKIEKQDEFISPFFHFNTYSDFLRTNLGKTTVVLNAGVPAHSSMQGLRHLERLSHRFSKKKIRISYVTIYYGNNDSCWNGNLEDKNIIPQKTHSLFNIIASDVYDHSLYLKVKIATLNRKRARLCKHLQITPRVSVEDYEKSIISIVQLCAKFGAVPIVIKPVVPIFWKPGMRIVQDEIDWKEYLQFSSGHEVLEQLEYANRLWNLAQAEIQKHGITDVSLELLKSAKENDFLIPRIKENYIFALQRISKFLKIPSVDIGLPCNEDDSKYFIDYCHPNEQLHEILAIEIAKIINKIKDFTLPDLTKIGETSESNTDLPDKIYTLY